eukprot:1378610-Amphidinium_carterae.1
MHEHFAIVWGSILYMCVFVFLGTCKWAYGILFLGAVVPLGWLSSTSRSCRMSVLCPLLLSNLIVFSLLLLLPRDDACKTPSETKEVDRQGQILDLMLIVALLFAVAAGAAYVALYVGKPVYAVPRDERLAGRRTVM